MSEPCAVSSGYIRPDGYATVRHRGRTEYVHRIVYRSVNGEIPAGFEIDHICGVRSCANPNHLRAVPPRVNVLAGSGPTAVNAAKTECVNGHPFSDDNTYTYVYRGAAHRRCRACQRATEQRHKQKKADTK